MFKNEYTKYIILFLLNILFLIFFTVMITLRSLAISQAREINNEIIKINISNTCEKNK